MTNQANNLLSRVRNLPWGETPWSIDFRSQPSSLPERVDFAVIGAGFSGLSAAAELRRLDPTQTVAVFETETVGAGSSGHTGGLALAETAAGDLPGLGDVLAGFCNILKNLNVTADVSLPGVWELDRTTANTNSPIRWSDSGQLRVAQEVSGGTVNPGKLVSGLAKAASERGALVLEGARVEHIDFGETLVIHSCGRQIHARRVLIATNAESLELSGLAGRADPKFTLAVATQRLEAVKLEALGLAAGKPFYTVDLPYLWGRLVSESQIIFGSGLVNVDSWRDLAAVDVRTGVAFRLLTDLKKRVTLLHPALAGVRFSHEWGGPILIGEEWRPVFSRHPRSDRALVLGAYSGHGVALSTYLGSWAAEVLLDRRNLPDWNSR